METDDIYGVPNDLSVVCPTSNIWGLVGDRSGIHKIPKIFNTTKENIYT